MHRCIQCRQSNSSKATTAHNWRNIPPDCQIDFPARKTANDGVDGLGAAVQGCCRYEPTLISQRLECENSGLIEHSQVMTPLMEMAHSPRIHPAVAVSESSVGERPGIVAAFGPVV